MNIFGLDSIIPLCIIIGMVVMILVNEMVKLIDNKKDE